MIKNQLKEKGYLKVASLKVINKSLSKISLNLVIYTNSFANIFGINLRKYSYNYKEFLRKYVEKW